MDFLRYFGINWTVTYCIYWISSPAGAKTIYLKEGSAVNLTCNNNSINTLSLLTWTLNGENLFTFKKTNETKTHTNENATRLGLKMSESEHQLYALIIENAQKSHEGNYTCQTTMTTGFFQENWELLITEDQHSPKQLIVAVGVSCACFLIISVAIILSCIWKRKVRRTAPPPSIRQQPREEIYENHMEIQRRAQSCAFKHGTC